MKTQALTDTMIRGATAPAGKRLGITDTRCVGLTLRVTHKGAQTFAYTYWSPKHNKMARLTLGKYPDLSLANARTMADRHRGTVARGDDPQASKIKTRQAGALTFDAVAQRYIDEYAKSNKTSHHRKMMRA